MLALSFSCRALFVLLLSESFQSVQSDRAAPFLITENMWPRGCVLDCQKGRHRPVCGSNGRLYKSLCSFQRAKCINTQLRIVPRAQCADPALTKCQLARAQGLEARSHSGGSLASPAAAVFVPECSPEGHFMPTQCHSQAGYCWCSTADGKPVTGTTVLQGVPNCTDAPDDPGPTSGPRRPAELTAPAFWMTILMNSGPKGNRSGTQPTESPRMCERERALRLSQHRSTVQGERIIPECTADGRYSPVQCHTATGYCWCVRVDTGRPLPGTSKQNRIPDCTGAVVTDRRSWEKPLPVQGHLIHECGYGEALVRALSPPTSSEPDGDLSRRPSGSQPNSLAGCPEAQKKQFLQSLIKVLQLEAELAGSLHQAPNPPPSVSPLPSSDPPSSSTASSSSSSSSSPLVDGPSESSRPKTALRWHFTQLDVDSSGALSEREARPLRHFLRWRLKPRRCAKKFAQYCDRDADRSLTLEELELCLGL